MNHTENNAGTVRQGINWIPMIQLSAVADNDEHRQQILAGFRASDGVKLVRDLHNPIYQPQQVACYFDDIPDLPSDNLPDGMRRCLVPSNWFA
jgi:hypothetical protein